VQSAAAHGFVAVAVTYDSWLTWLSPPAMDLHANCMFNTSNPGNAIAQVCARPEADCSKGFVVAGFSQGGAIAARSANVNSAVQAVWAIGVNGPNIPEAIAAPIGNRVLPNNRLRITVGQHDVAMDASGHPDLSALNAMTGQGCTTFSCLAPDGSGYYVVANSDTPSGNASHCYWFLNGGCSISPTLDAAFVNGTADWSLSANLSFLASRVSASIAPSADIDPRKLVVRRGAGRHPLVVGADGRLVRLRATTWQYARSHVADIRRRLNR
jgi:hypothetical protein